MSLANFTPVFLALALTSGCHRTTAADSTQGGVTTPDAASVDASEPPPRCSVGRSADLASDIDVGQATLVSGAAVVGVLRTVSEKRVASVARLPRNGTAVSFVDLAPVSGSVSPPSLFTRGDEVFAASAVRPAAAGGAPARSEASWIVFRIGPEKAEALAVLPDTVDSELAAVSGLAPATGSPFGAVIAWDESVKAPPRATRGADAGEEPMSGAVRVAFLTPDMLAVARVETVSPATSNAERPEVIARDGGFWVAWIARQPEPTREPAAELERPGEDRAYKWVELVALDGQGKAAGPVRRLTPLLGHVSGFEMMGGARSRVDVFVELDDERTLGAGGSIVHVVASLDSAPRTTPVVPEGRERGTASCLGAGPPLPSLMLYVDSTDHVRAVDLDAEGQSKGPASAEPSLDRTRLLVAGPPPSTPGGLDVLAWVPAAGGASAGLRWSSCDSRR